MENKSAANMGIKLLPHMRELCSKKDLPKSKVFAKVSELLKDRLLEAKLGFIPV